MLNYFLCNNLSITSLSLIFVPSQQEVGVWQPSQKKKIKNSDFIKNSKQNC